ncbi:hypothetical protein CK203_084329 [Vitis vinifera]|uniref:Uncharacterized protein n=1 Tax=Vitis vinifera TaxID=29760 RepID=A0A438DF96_VITVI|nr:hypothetical protein CK203_084329 [Vitis vinifera]
MRQTINASNEWWDKKLKENLEAIKFKTKSLKNVEQLDLLFKYIVATGEGAWAPSQGFVRQDVDNSSKLERICSAVENRSSISSRGDKPGCSIVEVMKIIRGMPEVKNDFELYMKATDIMVVKENREMYVALEDLIDQIAWLKHKHV